MDPITLAVLTSGVVTLASESAIGLASQAGKDAWSKIKTLFAWKKEPADQDLAPKVAEALNNNTQLAQQVLQLLQRPSTGSASTLVQSIHAEKVVVATNINTVNM